jgi:mono/diheme cytochrome c family protein
MREELFCLGARHGCRMPRSESLTRESSGAALSKMKISVVSPFSLFVLIGFVQCSSMAKAADGHVDASPSSVQEFDAGRGFDLLVNKPFLPPDFSEEIFDNVWQAWPKPLRAKAEAASPAVRRQMAMQRYGLTPRPGSESLDPLQYVVSETPNGKVWTMNCFSCHGGNVYGEPTPGAPNNRFALQTMTEELRLTKFKLGKPLSRMDLGAMFIPLGTTHGTTNAVVFGIGLMSRRDPRLNVIDVMPEPATHHDMDAPPWWHFYKRPNIYIDGFAERGHRGLMQFTLVPENGPDFYREHEEDFRHIYQYLMSLRPPKYEGPINAELALQGKHLFENSCSQCHGTYGDKPSYPNLRSPLDEIGTDPVRLTALPVKGRKKYAVSWFAHYDEPGQQETIIDPDGYVAPPLDGVWASAPYFHNGSVPTLWHVLNPQERPKIWHRTSDHLNVEQMGLTVESVDRIPIEETDIAIRREYFDTTRFGKSNLGHDFPNVLSTDEKRAVLEFLKTL